MSLTLVPPLHPTTPSYAAALAELSSVSLETLAAQAGRMTRIDRKYVIPADDLDAVFSSTAHEAVALEIEGRRTFGYSSIYFDTPDLRSFHDGGRRRRRRFKVRARSYLDSDLHFLEVKTRGARGTTVKERQSLPHPVHGGLDPAGQKFVATTLAAHGIPDLDPRDLHPTLEVTYRRSTLAFLSAGHRTTVDTDVRWTAQDGIRAFVEKVAVVETKAGSTPTAVDRALWRLGHRPMQISKYGAGMVTTHADLPHLKWHRTLTNPLLAHAS